MNRIGQFCILIIVILSVGCSPQFVDTLTEEFKITDFSSVHSPVNGDTNESLIFGNLSVTPPSADIPDDLAVFLGRWEGYSYAPPVKKDRKLVLHIAEISEQGGVLYGWSGTNLQYPDRVARAHFRINREKSEPMIEFQLTWIDDDRLIDRFTYDPAKKMLHGESLKAKNGRSVDVYELTRDQSFFVYKDYDRYLAGKNITTHKFNTTDLEEYSQGYMLYLPDGYAEDTQKKWPLIFFLHGSGDCGKNLQILAKASPYMYIRQKGPLPAVIAAPLFAQKCDQALLPEAFLEGTLDEVLAEYRVDTDRIYLTGLSLGGEATYRLALHRPETFAALAPLCGFLMDAKAEEMKKIKDIPVWAIHGADDTVVKPDWGQQPVNALKEAGGNIKFSLLPGHDHDVWTDTYSDPAFYDWLLAQHK
jgi:predicted esterase